MNNNMLHVSGSKDIPKIAPAPRSSLTAPRSVKAMEKPKPIPMPSKRLATGPFLQAKASARPRIIQFTTISGMYKPSVAYIAGTNACIIICRIVTKDAITTTKTGMRTISGVRFFIRDITRFEHINTNIVANPIDRPFIADVVVASVGHIPRRRTNVGFSFITPLSKIFI